MRTLQLTVAVLALVGVVCVGVVWATASVQPRGRAVVDGIVRDDTGQAVPDVQVRFLMGNGGGVNGESDAAGKWRVDGLGKGDWKAVFTARGFVTQATTVVVESEDPATILVPIVMHRAPATAVDVDLISSAIF